VLFINDPNSNMRLLTELKVCQQCFIKK